MYKCYLYFNPQKLSKFALTKLSTLVESFNMAENRPKVDFKSTRRAYRKDKTAYWLLEETVAGIFWQTSTQRESRDKYPWVCRPSHGVTATTRPLASGDALELMNLWKLFFLKRRNFKWKSYPIFSEPHLWNISSLHVFTNETVCMQIIDAIFSTHCSQTSLRVTPALHTQSPSKRKAVIYWTQPPSSCHQKSFPRRQYQVT